MAIFFILLALCFCKLHAVCNYMIVENGSIGIMLLTAYICYSMKGRKEKKRKKGRSGIDGYGGSESLLLFSHPS